MREVDGLIYLSTEPYLLSHGMYSSKWLSDLEKPLAKEDTQWVVPDIPADNRANGRISKVLTNGC